MPQHKTIIAEKTFRGKDDCEPIASDTTERGAVVVGFSAVVVGFSRIMKGRPSGDSLQRKLSTKGATNDQ